MLVSVWFIFSLCLGRKERTYFLSFFVSYSQHRQQRKAGQLSLRMNEAVVVIPVIPCVLLFVTTSLGLRLAGPGGQ